MTEELDPFSFGNVFFDLTSGLTVTSFKGFGIIEQINILNYSR